MPLARVLPAAVSAPPTYTLAPCTTRLRATSLTPTGPNWLSQCSSPGRAAGVEEMKANSASMCDTHVADERKRGEFILVNREFQPDFGVSILSSRRTGRTDHTQNCHQNLLHFGLRPPDLNGRVC